MYTKLLCSQISRNITTNELANAMRYNYLRGPGGRFRNPYDHGCRKNCSDFLRTGYNEDVEYKEESSEPEGISMMHMSRNSHLQNGVSGLSNQTNGNSHVAVNMNGQSNHRHGHVHSSQCNHSDNSKIDSVPLGLGLGLARNVTRSAIAT